MKVKALKKEWEVKPITPKRQQELYVAAMSCLAQKTIEEKVKMYNLFFECLELSEIEDLPDSLIAKSVLGMAILTEYCGIDKKKLSEQESQAG